MFLGWPEGGLSAVRAWYVQMAAVSEDRRARERDLRSAGAKSVRHSDGRESSGPGPNPMLSRFVKLERKPGRPTENPVRQQREEERPDDFRPVAGHKHVLECRDQLPAY